MSETVKLRCKVDREALLWPFELWYRKHCGRPDEMPPDQRRDFEAAADAIIPLFDVDVDVEALARALVGRVRELESTPEEMYPDDECPPEGKAMWRADALAVLRAAGFEVIAADEAADPAERG